MTTAATSHAGSSAIARVAQITAVELRKVAFTRASQIILLSTVVLGLLFAVAISVFGDANRPGEVDIAIPLVTLTLAVAVAAPLVGVLVMTSDWQSREIMTVVLLEPRRGLVFAGKVVSTIVLALLLVLAVALLSTGYCLVEAFATDRTVVYGSTWSALGPLLTVSVIGAVSGSAIAAALMNTPLAIILVILQTLVIDTALGFLPHGLGPYLRSSTVLDFTSGEATGAAALSSAAIWIVAPLVIGYLRMTRREVR